MNRLFVSKYIPLLLVIALSSQSILLAQTAAQSAQEGRIKQLQKAMHEFHKTSKSFINCLATGKCDSDQQKELASQVAYWSKRMLVLLAFLGTTWFVKKQALEVMNRADELTNQKIQQAQAAAAATMQQQTAAMQRAAGELVTQQTQQLQQQLGGVRVMGRQVFTTQSQAEQETKFKQEQEAFEKLQQERDAAFRQEMAQQRKQLKMNREAEEVAARREAARLREQEIQLNAQERALRAKQAEIEAREQKVGEAESYYMGQQQQQKKGWFGN